MKNIIFVLSVSIFSISAQAATHLKCSAIKRINNVSMPTWLINNEIIPLSDLLTANLEKTVENYKFAASFYNSDDAQRALGVSITDMKSAMKTSASFGDYSEIKTRSSQQVTIENQDGTMVALNCTVN